MSTVPANDRVSPEEAATVAELYALLSSCFQTPDEEFVEAADSGQLHEQLAERTEVLGYAPERPPTGGFDGVGDLHESYLRSFEGFEGAYAPPAESAYERWWDDRERGLLAGPAAADMRRRFEAVGADTPDRYPVDHVALLLEYASLVLEAEEVDEYVAFHREHFDWIDAFRERVEETCEAEFYLWAVGLLAETIERVEEVLLAEAELPDGETTDPAGGATGTDDRTEK
ncbi:MAG: molecular chaperone TorD family protein [Haloferacaceae archaeon]